MNVFYGRRGFDWPPLRAPGRGPHAVLRDELISTRWARSRELKDTVTIRCRDDSKQERLAIDGFVKLAAAENPLMTGTHKLRQLRRSAHRCCISSSRFKLIKGIALLLLALGVLSLANKDLSDVFDQFLRWVHLDPERSFFCGHWRLAGYHHARQCARSGLGHVSLRIFSDRPGLGTGVSREVGDLAGDWRIGVFHSD